MDENRKLPPLWSFQRTLFLVVVGIGGLLLVIGTVILPYEAHFQLDQVLSAEEIRDERMRDRTLEILKQVSQGGEEGPFVAVPGLALIVVGLIGIFAPTPKN